jgi:hypothetical protein
MAQNTLTQADWRSILRGAIVNIGGTILLTGGMFIGTIGNDGHFNWLVLKIALVTNLSTVIVNIAKKFLGT